MDLKRSASRVLGAFEVDSEDFGNSSRRQLWFKPISGKCRVILGVSSPEVGFTWTSK